MKTVSLYTLMLPFPAKIWNIPAAFRLSPFFIIWKWEDFPKIFSRTALHFELMLKYHSISFFVNDPVV